MLETLYAAGLDPADVRAVTVGVNPDAARGAFETLWKEFQPTACIARTDALALGVLRAARRLGLRIPDDLSVIGHDDTILAAFAEPPLTTVRIDCPQLGEIAAVRLLRQIEHPSAPIEPPATVQTLLIIAILAAILFPAFAQAREKARQTTCLSNMRQVGLGFRM